MSDAKDQQKVERETGTEGAGQSGGGAYPGENANAPARKSSSTKD
ncbi:MAG: hypothetical protein ACXW2T_02375 [Allosphingosinicella sp.]